jgi:hypothetical protein
LQEERRIFIATDSGERPWLADFIVDGLERMRYNKLNPKAKIKMKILDEEE